MQVIDTFVTRFLTNLSKKQKINLNEPIHSHRILQFISTNMSLFLLLFIKKRKKDHFTSSKYPTIYIKQGGPMHRKNLNHKQIYHIIIP